MIFREAAKKVICFSGPAIKRGEELRVWLLRKITCFEARKKIPKKLWSLSSSKGLSGRATKKITFFADSLTWLAWQREVRQIRTRHEILKQFILSERTKMDQTFMY